MPTPTPEILNAIVDPAAVFSMRATMASDKVVPTAVLATNMVVDAVLTDRFVVASAYWDGTNGLVERAAVTVPIAPDSNVGGATVFASPTDGSSVSIPTYDLVLDRVRFERSVGGWHLTVGLRATPATTGLIEPGLRVVLAYNLAGTGARNEVELGEVSRDGDVIVASVSSTDLEEQDRVFQALTESSWGANLIVGRTVTYAVPVQVPVRGRSDLVDFRTVEKAKVFDDPGLLATMRPGGVMRGRLPQAMVPLVDATAASSRAVARPATVAANPAASRILTLRPRGGGGEPVDEPPGPLDPPDPPDPEPPVDVPPPAMTTRYRIVTSTFDNVVSPSPFVFPVATNPALYVGIAGGTGSGGIAMVSHQLDGHVYLQESEGSATFYYLPDELRLARSAYPPHRPLMTLSFIEPPGASDTGVVDPASIVAALDFDVVPYVAADRLTAASSGLVQLAPGPYRNGATVPTLVPLRARSDRMELRLELGHDVAESALSVLSLDLASGFRCRLELPSKQFERVYKAMFSATTSLFYGAVEVTLTDVEAVHVPFSGRVADALCPTSLLEISDVAQAADGRISATVTNTLESPVRAEGLHLVARGGNAVVASSVVEPSGAVALAPGASVPVVVAVDPASTVGTLGFTAGGLTIDVDSAAVYDVVLDCTTPVTWSRQVEVNVARALLAGVAVLQVDLDGADAIAISAPEAGTSTFLPATAVVSRQPMRSVIVGAETSTDVSYRLRRILADGTKEPWTTSATDDTGGASLFITALPPIASAPTPA